MRPLLRSSSLARLPWAAAALILVLSAVPAAATTYYVNPSGSSGNTGTSPATPWSLTKALGSAIAGDVVYFAPGAYSVAFKPLNNGNAAARITFIGNISDPTATSVNGGIDLAARQYVTVKGINGGEVVVNSYTASQYALADSILYCKGTGGLWANGSQNCHVAYCTIGDGVGADVGESTNSPIRPFDNTFRHNIIHVGGMTSQPHAIGFDRATNCEFTDNNVTITMPAGAFDVHGRIQYGINHCLFRDNTWTMINYTGYLCYAFSHRDSARYNTYIREKVVESPLSTSPCYIRFATSGSYPGTCGYNTFIDCTFKANFTMDYQNDAEGDVWQGCTLISTGVAMDFSQVYSPVRTTTFRHCTFFTTNNVAAQVLKSTGLRMVSNVFYTGGSNCPGVFLPVGASADSNLFFQKSGNSGGAYGALTGACSSPPANSRWGSPSFVDSSYSNFDPTPRSNSAAIGSFWKDGYVGARPFTQAGPDNTAPAAVNNLGISQVTDHSLLLSWTAPGDDGSSGTATAYDLRYSSAPITSLNFDAATPVISQPSPLPGGSLQTFVALNLTANTQYYFALKTRDEVNNWSGVSNSPGATTTALDVTAPAAVQDLRAGP